MNKVSRMTIWILGMAMLAAGFVVMRHAQAEDAAASSISDEAVHSEEASGTFKSKNRRFEVIAPDQYKESLEIKRDDHALKIKPLDGSDVSPAEVKMPGEPLIRYIDAYPGVDVEHVQKPDRLKESLILKGPNHPETFVYEINTQDFRCEINGAGDIEFRDTKPRDFSRVKSDDGSLVPEEISRMFLDEYPLVFKIEAPFMVDAKGENSGKEAVKAEIKGDRLILTPDKQWLSEHKYPVNLDPTVQVEPRAIEEVSSNRTLQGVTFRNSDGTYSYRARVGAVIHYEDKEKGGMYPVDTTVVPSTDPAFDLENTTNTFSTYFNRAAKSAPNVKFKEGDSWIAFTIEDVPGLGERRPVEGAATSGEFIYSGMFDETDVRYLISGRELREEYVLHEYRDVRSISQIMTFSADLDFKHQPDGSLVFFKKETGEEVFTLPRPVMYEVNKRERQMPLPERFGGGACIDLSRFEHYGLRYELEQLDDRAYRLTKVLDETGSAWLASPERVFPIVIDDSVGPTSITDGDNDGIDAKESPYDGWYVNGISNRLYFCRFGSGTNWQYPGFSWTLPAIDANATINEMYFRAYSTSYGSGTQIENWYLGVQNMDPDQGTVKRWQSDNLIRNASWINTTATGTCSFASNTWYFGESDAQSKNLYDDLQDLIATYGAIASGDRINIALYLLADAGDYDYAVFEDVVNAAGHTAQLSIDWTPGPSSTAVYYSVGTSTADLKGSINEVDIDGGVATFNAAAANNIGVGDKITYSGSSVCYISGRTSSTVFSVITATGGTPTNATDATVNTITRTFNSLSAAVSGSSGGSYLGTTDLTTTSGNGPYQLNWPCYGDGADATATVDGYTTSTTSYIRIYTPVSTSEVGISQRHTGTWTDSGAYRLQGSNTDVLTIADNFVSIDGLQVKLTSTVANSYAVELSGSLSDGAEIQISNCIVWGVISGGSATDAVGVIGQWVGSGTRTAKLKNNVVYGFSDGSVELLGIMMNAGWYFYCYNNTVYNCYIGFYADDPLTAKNNVVRAASYDGYYGNGFGASCDYNSSSISGDAPVQSPRNNTSSPWYSGATNDSSIFVNANTDNFHLKVSSIFGGVGADLDGDGSLPVTDDIDGEARDGTNPDIGADECYLARQVYYSVGTSTADLKSGVPTMTIADGTAVFSVGQPNNVGTGDEITYNTSSKCYISGRTSTTCYSVVTATGAMPSNVAGATVNSIKRTFNSLSAAVSGSSGINYLDATDLVTNNYELNWVCYEDGDDTTAVAITGYTTGPLNFIDIYAPREATEVGASQRHTAVADSGFCVAPSTSSPANPYYVIDVAEEYVRIRGIEIDGSGITNGTNIGAIRLNNSLSDTSDVRVDACIIHDFNSGTGTNIYATYGIDQSGGALKLSNSILYDIQQRYTGGSVAAVNLNEAGVTDYVYNNTIYNITETQSGSNAYGIRAQNGDVVAKNNYVGDVDGGLGATEECFSGTFASGSSNNVSSDATANSGNLANGQTGKTSYSSYFKSVTGGSEDLRLQNNSNTLWGSYGADLDTDTNLPITEDIKGAARDASQPDIGADEYGVRPLTAMYYSVGTSTAALYSGNASATSGTLNLVATADNNIGVGDEVRVGSSYYYITGRNSSQQFTIQNSAANSGTPGDTNITFTSQAITIYRAFNTLNAAVAGVGNSSHLGTFNLVTGNFQLNLACYKDGIDSTAVTVNGYTTGADNYIRIYTPVSSSEVGTSQRHRGAWNTSQGYCLQIANSSALLMRDNHIRVEGLQVGVTSVAANYRYGCYIEDGYIAADNEIRFSHCIFKGNNQSSYYEGGIYAGDASTILYVDNTVLFNYTITSNDGSFRVIEFTGTTAYLYNNTVIGGNRGINRSAGSVIAKNNGVFMSEDNCFNGTFAYGSTNNVSSDATANSGNLANGQTGKTGYSSYFRSITGGSEDFRLQADSNALWGSYGADLDQDQYIVITDDIDGQTRDSSTPDIGADEWTLPVPVYYSVGTSTADLKGSITEVDIASGTATFDAAAATNIGVGDKVTYGGSNYCYISGRNSALSFDVITATGDTPEDAEGAAVNSIARTFNTLSAAVSGSDDLLGTSSLIAANVQLNWPCYSDTNPDETAVTVDVYTTGPDNYIRIYTPTSSSEVGASQRHQGTWDTGGYRLEITDTIGIKIYDDFVRIEGIKVQLTSSSSWTSAIEINNLSDGAEVNISHSILKGVISGSADNTWGIRMLYVASGSRAIKVWNNVIYDFINGSNSTIYGIKQESGYATYFYNNTLHTCYNGINLNGSNFVARNVITQSCTDGFNDPGWGWGTGTGNNLSNLSSDAPGSGSVTATLTFANAGGDNFHLAASDTAAIGAGADLDQNQYIQVTDDIDGQTRDTSTPDIGADEYIVPPPVVEQEGYRFRRDNSSESGASWLAVQDTDITRAKNTNTRLRVLLNATNNPPSSPYQLEYKKSTDSTYAKVPLTSASGPRLTTQYNTATISAGYSSADATLTTNISDLSRAFLVMWSSGDSGAANASSHQATGYLWDDSGTTKIKFERDSTTDDCQVAYFVVECQNNEFEVFRGSSAAQITSGNSSVDASIGDTIDQSRSMVILSSRSNDIGTDIYGGYATGKFKDNSNLTFDRGTTVDTCTIRWEVVEWSTESGVTVQNFEKSLSGNMSSGVTATAPTEFTAVTPAETWLYSTFRHATNGLEQTAIRTTLTNGSTITFDRNTTTTSYQSYARVWLVEFNTSSVVVQHLSDSALSTDLTEDTPCSAVTLANSWVWATDNCAGTGTAFPRNRWNYQFTSTTNVRAERWYNGQASESNVQVIDSSGWTFSESAPILMAASGNIAASGENTTAQLTPPSGKTTGDFVAGRIQDDENPADSVDITTNDYTELEWCIKVTDDAAIDDIYQFRVTANGTPIDTYSVTPQLTVVILPVYYSVGTSTADLKGSITEVDIDTGVATFNAAAANNIGVGDKVTYGGATVCYISGRTSPTVFSVITATGDTPNDATDATVNSIMRTFNTLSAAVSGSGTLLGTTDLTTGFRLNWPCYGDANPDQTAVVNGYTTGPNSYIRIYTPTDSSEVGTSQRHNGKWTSSGAYRIETTSSCGIMIYEEYVRIEGLQFKHTVSGSVYAVTIYLGYNNASSDTRIIDNIFWADFSGLTYYGKAIGREWECTVNAKVWNNIIYNYTGASMETDFGIAADDGTWYIYNNTLYNCTYGIYRENPAIVTATNNAVLNSSGACFYGTMTQSYNVSSDGTASGTGSQTGKTSYSSYFQNITGGSEDLHLKADSNALWGSYGTPLADVTDDIDGKPRHATTPDIGADEYRGVSLKHGKYWHKDSAVFELE